MTVIEAPAPHIEVNPRLLINNGRYAESNYYRRFVLPLLGTPLIDLHEKLMDPLRKENDITLSIGQVAIAIAPPFTNERLMAADIVNHGYNARHRRNHGSIKNVAYDQYDNTDTTNTLVATLMVDQVPVVLGTFRTIEGIDLEVFHFFEMADGAEWPHISSDTQFKPGELGRFSLHPFLDVLRNSQKPEEVKFAISFKRQILRKLWEFGMAHMRSSGVDVPYFTLAPEVYAFVVSSGIIPQRLTNAVPSHSELSEQVRFDFKEYWKPDGRPAEQPALYIAPWELTAIDKVMI